MAPDDEHRDRRDHEAIHAPGREQPARHRHRGTDPRHRGRGKDRYGRDESGQNPHAWFIAFAPADHPRYAIAVLVEHGGTDGAECGGDRRPGCRADRGFGASHLARDVTQCDPTVSRSRPDPVEIDERKIGFRHHVPGRPGLLEPLSNRARDRSRRYGRGLPRPRSVAESAGRAQGAVSRSSHASPRSSSGSGGKRRPPRTSTTRTSSPSTTGARNRARTSS